MDDTTQKVHDEVKEYYSTRVKENSCCCESNSLYPVELIDSLPNDIGNFSFGCGNPITLAGFQSGEVVLDLGSGGGLDCFFAAKLVGDKGKVYGVDMTDEMLQKAKEHADKLGIKNVEFRKGYLESLPIDDESIDVVISNCVINLSPTKEKVFSEIYRVLAPGGRIAVSDIVRMGEISEHIQQMADSWSACLSGALSVYEFTEGLTKAGLIDIKIQAKDVHGDLSSNLPEKGLFSAAITARKPK